MPENDWVARAQKAVAHPKLRWAHDPALWVELFVTVNLAILSGDIFIAHSVNHFGKTAECIPLYFSIAAPIVLAVLIACAGWVVFGRLGGMWAILPGGSRFLLGLGACSITSKAAFFWTQR